MAEPVDQTLMAEPQQPVDQTQQVTSKTPATKQKNPKRVAAGKKVAERTRLARQAQKKALIEAQSIIAKHPVAEPPVADPPADPPVVEPPADPPSAITITQWLSGISILVSWMGIYYKREEIKKFFDKKAPPPRAPPPSPVLPRAPVDASKGSIRKMD